MRKKGKVALEMKKEPEKRLMLKVHYLKYRHVGNWLTIQGLHNTPLNSVDYSYLQKCFNLALSSTHRQDEGQQEFKTY